jgi:phytol kinase
MTLILTVLGVFIILLGSEFWWRRHVTHSEFSRKFVHITVGSFVAFWPFYLSWNQIRWLSLSFLVVVGVSKYLHLFRIIHSVQRPTMGELYFALATGAITYVTHDKWIYMASLLQMSLADGFAAVVGVRYGRQSYLMFSHRKTLIGSATFFVVSLGILVAYTQAAGAHLGPAYMAGVALLMAVVENFAVAGLDNLLVPLAVAWLLVNH